MKDDLENFRDRLDFWEHMNLKDKLRSHRVLKAQCLSLILSAYEYFVDGSNTFYSVDGGVIRVTECTRHGEALYDFVWNSNVSVNISFTMKVKDVSAILDLARSQADEVDADSFEGRVG